MIQTIFLGILMSTLFSLCLVQSKHVSPEDSESKFYQQLANHRKCLRVVDNTLKSLQQRNQNEISSVQNVQLNKTTLHCSNFHWDLSAKIEQLDGKILKIQTAINSLNASKSSAQMGKNKTSGLAGTLMHPSKTKTVEGFILATEDGVVTVTLPAFHRTQIISKRTYLVAFDWGIQKVYYVDLSRTGSIKRANLDGTDAEIFLDGKTFTFIIISDISEKLFVPNFRYSDERLAGEPFGLAVDSYTGNVYSAHSESGEIKVCSRDGEKSSVLATGQKGISTLAVHSSKSLIFWTTDTGIVRANLDGTNATTILLRGFLRGIDESSDRLYWEQGREIGLASSDLQGKDGRILLNNADHLSGVAIYDDVVYFSNGTDEKVRSVNQNGTNVAIATKTTASVNGITMYGRMHKALSRPNPCASSPCSYLCVLKIESFACLCPKGKRLDQDGTSCVEIPVIPE